MDKRIWTYLLPLQEWLEKLAILAFRVHIEQAANTHVLPAPDCPRHVRESVVDPQLLEQEVIPALVDLGVIGKIGRIGKRGTKLAVYIDHRLASDYWKS